MLPERGNKHHLLFIVGFEFTTATVVFNIQTIYRGCPVPYLLYSIYVQISQLIINILIVTGRNKKIKLEYYNEMHKIHIGDGSARVTD